MSKFNQNPANQTYQVEVNPERLEVLANVTITGPMSVWAGWQGKELPWPVRGVLIAYGAFQIGRSTLYILEKYKESQLPVEQLRQQQKVVSAPVTSTQSTKSPPS